MMSSLLIDLAHITTLRIRIDIDNSKQLLIASRLYKMRRVHSVQIDQSAREEFELGFQISVISENECETAVKTVSIQLNR